MNELPPSPPKWINAILNALISAILRSPLHGILSGMCILLTFKGSKSGTIYTFPVGYYDLREESLVIIPLHRWWVNLRGSIPVTVWLKGKKYEGIADASYGDSDTISEMQRLIEGSSNLMRMYKIQRDSNGQLDPARTYQIAQSLPLVRIRLSRD
jgi:hypothetical protein